MLCRAVRGRYDKLMEELQNNFTKGNKKYPANMTEAYNLLVKYKTNQSNPETRLVYDSEDVLFSNVIGSKGKSNSYKSGVGGVDRDERNLPCY